MIKKIYEKIMFKIYEHINFKRWVFNRLIKIIKMDSTNLIDDHIRIMDELYDLAERIGKKL